jgi:hypothetical protein
MIAVPGQRTQLGKTRDASQAASPLETCFVALSLRHVVLISI